MNASLRFLTGGIAGAVVAGLLVSPATAAPLAAQPQAAPAAAAASDKTSAVEARRVDSVPTPKLGWYPCYDYAECATVRLPLDYDKPKGATTEIAVLRVKAKDQKHKIGSLFLNPGGPGGSGAETALAAPYFVSDQVWQKFDFVGFDPRGIGASERVRCFKDVREQTGVLSKMNMFFPVTKAEERGFIAGAKALGKACSTTGKPLTGAASTAQAARDMDVLRRAVGDRKLTYVGFSYGTALGQYYANMFPDRVRSLTVDGVINPVSWVGVKKPGTILDDRLRSADGAYRALKEIFVRCDRADTEACPISGDSAKKFDLAASRLKANPIVIDDPVAPGQYGYDDFVGDALSILYAPYAGDEIAYLVADVLTATDPSPSTSTADKTAARKRVATRVAKLRAHAPGREFPYNNGLESQATVVCTDALHPNDAAAWPKLTAKSDKRAPYFGKAWAWSSVMCARNTWTVRDEDAYTGPFNRRTSAPVLVVGSYWDPATNYDDAVSSAALLPNSRLLSSDNWGHTAYGTSACVNEAIEGYILTGALPAKGTVCHSDVQPFQPVGDARRGATNGPRTERVTLDPAKLAEQGAPAAGEQKLLPPVITPSLPLR